jgi:uncharacterized protein YceK
VTARTLAAVAVLIVVVISGCGSSGKDTSATTTVAGNAGAGEVTVIKRWADELRAGDVVAAS